MAKVTQELREFVNSLADLARSGADVKIFWEQYVRQFAAMCGADKAILAGKVGDYWKVAHAWVPPEKNWPMTEALATLAETALRESTATGRVGNDVVLAIRIDVGPQEAPPVLLACLAPEVVSLPDPSSLLLAASIPSFFQISRQYKQARHDVVFMGELFQLVGDVAKDEKFKLAVMRMCNSCAALFRCGQVSIGWLNGKKIKIKAISNLESFEEKAKAVWELEAAMEEAAIQEAEIVWPRKEGSSSAVRAHETYAGLRRVGNLVSLPIRCDGETIGVMTCEREGVPFSDDEVWRLRLLLEQTSLWLSRLELQDKWLGARIWSKVTDFGKKLISPEGTCKKFAFIAALALIVYLFAGVWPHSVDGTFILKAQNSIHVTAPVDGYIDNAPVEPGDVVAAGDLLLELDTRELLLDQSEVVAKLARHRHEAEKARASKSLADMRIAKAMEEEAFAEMERIAFYLKQAKVAAPFDGVVASGDLRTRIGAPVRQGEELMTVASLENLYAEIAVNEKEISEIRPGFEADISFVGNPEQKYRVRVEKIVPLAIVDKGANVFMVQAKLMDERLSWWRPGMSGVAKFDVGYRSPWWILTHDAIDYLQLHFWM
ncbi:efflux RND transporter periplasmic adaptor subunit [Halodesulfovibrio sp.]|jgi:RND family efflux transporter MFP subunit|uniref:efflux RND transporter periplasmic adaptor subunit n=1 Tax=Halodesulfovibrio sp. TaxID=1912772 RepID=UPI0025FB9C6D|nr:efflux RND transporter periplasmic adaptor subunit [Halodesulfovibrio sp.]MCT4627430.1 efflux RND transporter periplasmic adaptor subunit [Halodesulfovibrio sp.]